MSPNPDSISQQSDRDRPGEERPSHPMGASLLVVGGVTLLIVLLAVLSSF